MDAGFARVGTPAGAGAGGGGGVSDDGTVAGDIGGDIGRDGAGVGGTGVVISEGIVLCIDVPPYCFDGVASDWPETIDWPEVNGA